MIIVYTDSQGLITSPRPERSSQTARRTVSIKRTAVMSGCSGMYTPTNERRGLPSYNSTTVESRVNIVFFFFFFLNSADGDKRGLVSG